MNAEKNFPVTKWRIKEIVKTLRTSLFQT